MQIILCNIQMFSNDQMIHIYDTEKKQTVFAQKADIEDLSSAICAIANCHGISEVRLSGQSMYAAPLVEEIKTTYALNYGNNIINVEVM